MVPEGDRRLNDIQRSYAHVVDVCSYALVAYGVLAVVCTVTAAIASTAHIWWLVIMAAFLLVVGVPAAVITMHIAVTRHRRVCDVR